MWVIILFKKFIFFLIIFLLVPLNVYASGGVISAECAVVIDSSTKHILFAKNAYYEHSMASTTKVMTCLLACESGRLGDTVEITEEMLENSEGSNSGLKSGDSITLYDLVKCAMLESGNDAANAIAVYLGGSVKNFAEIMNESARKIGMNNTNFVTPSGLDDEEHHSTAYDMALLACEAMKNGELSSVASMQSSAVKINGKEKMLYNHNRLLRRSKHFIGLKTGYTSKSGRCLISVYKYKGNNIVTVTLNAPDDWSDHVKLVRYSKKEYERYEDKRQITINTVGSAVSSVKCSYSYKVFTCAKPSVKLYYYPFVYAPVKRGDVLGEARIYSENTYIKTVFITADEDL